MNLLNIGMKIELASPLAMNSSIASTASLNAPDLLDFTKVSLYSWYGLMWDSSIQALQERETRIFYTNRNGEEAITTYKQQGLTSCLSRRRKYTVLVPSWRLQASLSPLMVRIPSHAITKLIYCLRCSALTKIRYDATVFTYT